jgi:hypothetical protein
MSQTPNDVQLQWVLEQGELCHVSTFARLPPEKRPEVYCPQCQRPVVLKLGHQLAHHAAHRPEDTCVVQQAETAVHLNAKLHIAQELRQQSVLHLSQSCAGCGKTRPWRWPGLWDAVQVETRLDERIQPDILLLAKGEPVGGIEVLVSHAVDEAKALRLQRRRLPWVEVAGRETLYLGVTAWHADQPLPVRRQVGAVPAWLCEKCIQGPGSPKLPPAAAGTEGWRCLGYKVVDLYRPDGRWQRWLYLLVGIYRGGVVTAYALERDDIGQGSGGEVLRLEGKVGWATAVRQMLAAGRQQLSDQRSQSVLVDSPMPWTYAPPPLACDQREFPSRLGWDHGRQQWQWRWDTMGRLWGERP